MENLDNPARLVSLPRKVLVVADDYRERAALAGASGIHGSLFQRPDGKRLGAYALDYPAVVIPGDVIDGLLEDTNPHWVNAPYEVAFWFAKPWRQRYWTRKRRLKHKRRQARWHKRMSEAQKKLSVAIVGACEHNLLVQVCKAITTPPPIIVPPLELGHRHLHTIFGHVIR
jgi:hypothetical protein